MKYWARLTGALAIATPATTAVSDAHDGDGSAPLLVHPYLKHLMFYVKTLDYKTSDP